MANYKRTDKPKRNDAIKAAKHKELNSIKTLVANGNISTATSEMIRFLEKYPNDVFGHYQYGKILMLNNDLSSAKREFQTVVDAHGKNRYHGLTQLGRIAELEQDYNLARRYYRQAITENPYPEEYYATLALAHVERESGYYTDALKVLSTIKTSTPEVQLERAKNLTALEREREAEDILARLVPENELQAREIAVEKGKIYKARYEYDKAKAYYEVAKDTSERDKIYYQAVMELARLAKQTNNYRDLVTYCEELYAANRTFNGTVNISLGIGKLALGQYQNAKKIFEMSLGVNDHISRASAAYHLSSLQILEGNEGLAEKTLKDSMKITPNAERLIYIKLIKLLYSQGRYDEADSYFSKAAAEDYYTDDDYGLRRLGLLLDKAQGRTLPKRESQNYMDRQIISYSQEEALAHIEENHKGAKPNNSSFSQDMNIGELFEEMLTQLNDDNMLSLAVPDEYEISYPNAGYRDGQIYDTIRVITIPGTKQIISMYPCEPSPLPTKAAYAKESGKRKNKASDRVSKFNNRFAKFTNQQ